MGWMDYKYTQSYDIYSALGADAKYNITNQTQFYYHYQLFFSKNGESGSAKLTGTQSRMQQVHLIGVPLPHLASLCLQADTDYFTPGRYQVFLGELNNLSIPVTIGVWFGPPPSGIGTQDIQIGTPENYFKNNLIITELLLDATSNGSHELMIHSVTSGNDTLASLTENITWLNGKGVYPKCYVSHGAFADNKEWPRYQWSNNTTYYIAGYLLANGMGDYGSHGSSAYSYSTGLNSEYGLGASPIGNRILNFNNDWPRVNLANYSLFTQRINISNLGRVGDFRSMGILYAHPFTTENWVGGGSSEMQADVLSDLSLLSDFNDSGLIFLGTTMQVVGYYSMARKMDIDLRYNASGDLTSIKILAKRNETYYNLTAYETTLESQYGLTVSIKGIYPDADLYSNQNSFFKAHIGDTITLGTAQSAYVNNSHAYYYPSENKIVTTLNSTTTIPHLALNQNITVNPTNCSTHLSYNSQLSLLTSSISAVSDSPISLIISHFTPGATIDGTTVLCFNAYSPSAAILVVQLSGLKANGKYNVSVDGTFVLSIESDSTGQLIYEYGGSWSSHYFEIGLAVEPAVDDDDEDDSNIIAGDINWGLIMLGGGAFIVFLILAVVLSRGKRAPEGGSKS
jgi:hypothetical protein